MISERISLIQQLEDEYQKAIFRIIDGMLTKAKFKDFFDENIAELQIENKKEYYYYGTIIIR